MGVRSLDKVSGKKALANSIAEANPTHEEGMIFRTEIEPVLKNNEIHNA